MKLVSVLTTIKSVTYPINWFICRAVSEFLPSRSSMRVVARGISRSMKNVIIPTKKRNSAASRILMTPVYPYCTKSLSLIEGAPSADTEIL